MGNSVLEAIKAYWAEFKIPPTVRAIQRMTGISTTSTVWYWYGQLRRRGLLVISKGKPVPIEIWNKLGDLSNEQE